MCMCVCYAVEDAINLVLFALPIYDTHEYKRQLMVTYAPRGRTISINVHVCLKNNRIFKQRTCLLYKLRMKIHEDDNNNK